MTRRARRLGRRLHAQDGFTMIIAIGVMFVTGLLLVAAFTVANGEVFSARSDTQQKQAYYAALAGVQQYEAKLQAEPSYWQTCEGPAATLPTEAKETGSPSYAVTVLPATGAEACSTSKPFESVIESKGTLTNTFRIKSVGTVGVGGNKATRSLVATFKVSGFLDYVYYTNFETEDPGLYNAPSGCAEKYRNGTEGWLAAGLSCETITFTNKDDVKGPMHTNDASRVVGEVSFGREGHSPADQVEINGGTYPQAENEKCEGAEANFYTSTSCYTTKGPTILPPESDTSLALYVEPENHFEGETRLVLNGAAGTITVTSVKANTVTKKIETVTGAPVNWPKNGLIYVSGSCAESSKSYETDTETEMYEKASCGTVYVSGTYSKSLTIAGTNDVVINGNISPTGLTLGNEPTGTATMGLIAGEYVRVYHPVKQGSTNAVSTCSASNLNAAEDPLKWGTMTDPWVYAAILSTNHSFFVDNFRCGTKLEYLNVYGAIAQDYRGIVGQTGGSGYLKDYKYDSRLATDEPPYFLAPLKSGWKIARETAPSPG